MSARIEVLAPRSSEFNLYDYESTSNFIKEHNPEVVVHSAAYYGGLNINVEEPANLFRNNTLMTTNIYEASAKNGVKKVVAVGSACAYPGEVVGDMKEEDFWSGPMHDSVIGYGSSKKNSTYSSEILFSAIRITRQSPFSYKSIRRARCISSV